MPWGDLIKDKQHYYSSFYSSLFFVQKQINQQYDSSLTAAYVQWPINPYKQKVLASVLEEMFSSNHFLFLRMHSSDGIEWCDRFFKWH